MRKIWRLWVLTVVEREMQIVGDFVLAQRSRQELQDVAFPVAELPGQSRPDQALRGGPGRLSVVTRCDVVADRVVGHLPGGHEPPGRPPV